MRFSVFRLMCAAVVATAVPAFARADEPAKADAFVVLDQAHSGGDADIDYLNKIVALNKEAIDAAKSILKTSTDADVRMMAGDSMKQHDAEARRVRAWLALHGPATPMMEVLEPADAITPTATLPAPASVSPAILSPATAPALPPKTQPLNKGTL